jgi:transcriptional regulator with XRE-family HTH domain
MAQVPPGAARLARPFELGLQVARGRRRAKVSQAAFAQKLGVSRKTVSDLERGAAENVSLTTAMAALSLAGYALYSVERRLPTMEEIMERRAADRIRADTLLSARAAASTPSSALPSTSTSVAKNPRPKRGV